MPTVAEKVFAAEFEYLAELAQNNQWTLSKLGPLSFLLGLPAKDREIYFVLCDCGDYPEDPPKWQWADGKAQNCGTANLAPDGSGYFHGSGVICAPWNRLSYNDRGGPHNDWEVAAWRENSLTGGCDSLPHMALRLSVELQGPRYKNRKGKAA